MIVSRRSSCPGMRVGLESSPCVSTSMSIIVSPQHFVCYRKVRTIFVHAGGMGT
jgi:hypothetical protein